MREKRRLYKFLKIKTNISTKRFMMDRSNLTECVFVMFSYFLYFEKCNLSKYKKTDDYIIITKHWYILHNLTNVENNVICLVNRDYGKNGKYN